jgi:hypothetical protein
MTLVSSANIIGSVKVFIVFIVGERSFMYIIKSKGPRIDPVFVVDIQEEEIEYCAF